MLRSYFSRFPLLFASVFFIPFLALTGCDTLSGNSDGGEGPPFLPPDALGIDHSSLWWKMREYEIEAPE
jgi:hypothetical protein